MSFPTSKTVKALNSQGSGKSTQEGIISLVEIKLILEWAVSQIYQTNHFYNFPDPKENKVTKNKAEKIYRNTKLSSAKKDKIQNVWKLIKEYHACQETGKHNS